MVLCLCAAASFRRAFDRVVLQSQRNVHNGLNVESMADSEAPCIYAPHHDYNKAVANLVQNMSMRDKRIMYVAIRQEPLISANSFLPRFGLNVADLVTVLVISERSPRTL